MHSCKVIVYDRANERSNSPGRRQLKYRVFEAVSKSPVYETSLTCYKFCRNDNTRTVNIYRRFYGRTTDAETAADAAKKNTHTRGVQRSVESVYQKLLPYPTNKCRLRDTSA